MAYGDSSPSTREMSVPPPDCGAVYIKAHSVHDQGNGVFAVLIPLRQLAGVEEKMVEELLPDLQEGFYQLLRKQALLSAVASNSDIKPQKLDY